MSATVTQRDVTSCRTVRACLDSLVQESQSAKTLPALWLKISAYAADDTATYCHLTAGPVEQPVPAVLSPGERAYARQAGAPRVALIGQMVERGVPPGIDMVVPCRGGLGG